MPQSASGSTWWSTETARRSASRRTWVSASARCSGGDGVVGVAEDADAPAAQHGRGELGQVAGRPAEIDQPAAGTEGEQRRPRRARRRPGRSRRRPVRLPRRPAGRPDRLGPRPVAAPRRRRLRPPEPARRRSPTGRPRPRGRRPDAGRRPARPGRPRRWPRAPPPARRAAVRPARSAPSRPRSPTCRSPPPPSSATSAVIGTRSAAGTAHHSARLPSTGSIPAEVANQTRRARRMIGRLRDHADPLNAGDVRQRLLAEVGRPAGAEQVERHDGRGAAPRPGSRRPPVRARAARPARAAPRTRGAGRRA